MSTWILRLTIVAIAAVCVAVSWGWGGPGGESTGWFGACVMAVLVLGPSLVLKRRSVLRPLTVGMFLAVACLIVIGCTSIAEPAGPHSYDKVVPLANLLGGATTTSDMSPWSILSTAALVLAFVGGLVLWAMVLLVHRKASSWGRVGNALEAAGWLEAYGVDKSGRATAPPHDSTSISRYGSSLGTSTASLPWELHETPNDVDEEPDER